MPNLNLVENGLQVFQHGGLTGRFQSAVRGWGRWSVPIRRPSRCGLLPSPFSPSPSAALRNWRPGASQLVTLFSNQSSVRLPIPIRRPFALRDPPRLRSEVCAPSSCHQTASGSNCSTGLSGSSGEEAREGESIISTTCWDGGVAVQQKVWRKNIEPFSRPPPGTSRLRQRLARFQTIPSPPVIRRFWIPLVGCWHSRYEHRPASLRG